MARMSRQIPLARPLRQADTIYPKGVSVV
jgi:hypothetical protein